MPGYESDLRDDMEFPVEIFEQNTARGPVEVAHHWHDCFELLYTVEGEALQWVNGHSFPMTAGDMLLLHSGDIHATVCGEHPTRIFVLKFMPSVLSPHFARAFPSPFLTGYLNQADRAPGLLPSAQRARILPLLREIETENETRENGYEFFIRSNIQHITGCLVRGGLIRPLPARQEQPGLSGIRRIVEYIEQHYDRDIRLGDIAAAAHMSEAYLSRFFRRVTGRGYKQYLDYVRTANATLLMLRGMNVTQAAAACGFSSPQAMSRTYSRMMGFAPSALKCAKR